ncbi:flagellar hook protein FlgE [Rhodovulum sp. ES.010]|uniref:flagellar hook protein FlgE n=1 Tax=Rhodovulum sp. ES.010 TaxID=1882821 RepID=UPI00092839CD|nr:flagellar hook-basal body complex protein [Rhodovulum sp. ES.010]SIO49725.1 flagellar hook protein FlgE [Rhodovulum sp. ES.010]
MTISSSLNAGVAGLAANANRLSTISDNIANSQTYGYKRAQADFHSMVIDSVAGTYSAGGVRITTSRMIDQAGALETTDNPTDLAVRGRGFLPVTQETALISNTDDYPMYLTTTGSFRTDEDGVLRNSTGLVLMGWPANPDGTIPAYPRDTSDGLRPVQIQTNQFAAEPTTEVTLGVNLPATETIAGADGTTIPLSVEYFDNLGTSQSINVTYTPTVPASGASNQWTMTLRDSAQGGAVVGVYTLNFDNTTGSGGTLASVTQPDVDASGVPTPPPAGGPIGGAYNATSGEFQVTVDRGPIDISIGAVGDGGVMTQLSDSFGPTGINKNGFPVGNMTSIEVDGNGFVKANFDTGITRTIYQVPIIDVPNPNGLVALDNQTYTTSDTSGSFFMWDAGDGPTGDVISYSLEESATDVAGELTELIQTQRAYSSNAKVIQTVDEMLQETTNIKR